MGLVRHLKLWVLTYHEKVLAIIKLMCSISLSSQSVGAVGAIAPIAPTLTRPLLSLAEQYVDLFIVVKVLWGITFLNFTTYSMILQ